VLSLSTNALAAGAPVAPAAGAPPPSNRPRAESDDRFDRIFKTLSSDPQSSGADAPAGDVSAKADAVATRARTGKSGDQRAVTKTKESQESQESGTCKESKESKESGEAGEAGKSGKTEKSVAPNTSIAAELVPVTPPIPPPQPAADAAGLRALVSESAAGEAESAAPQGQGRAGLSGRQVIDGLPAAVPGSVDEKASANAAGRVDALDSALDAGDDAAAGAVAANANAENANAENVNQVADAASRRSARNQPTPAELRAAAGISTDLRAAIRQTARNTTGDGQDAGASSDRGSRAPLAASVAQASQFAALASDVRAAAGPISPELLTGPYLQNAVRVSSLEAAAATALDRDGASVSSQIVESIRLQWAKGAGDAQMTLQPGYLGGLSVSLRVDKDVVTASVLAESPAVREWLRANESSLRQGLVDVGLRLEKFQVSDVSAQTPARDADARDRPSGRDRQSAPRQPRPDRSDSTFEVIAE
jgi:flagellar hook-length control protein FliK